MNEVLKRFLKNLYVNTFVVFAAMVALAFVHVEGTGIWPTAWFL